MKIPLFQTILCGLIVSVCGSEKSRIAKECGSAVLWHSPPKEARFGHYNYVYPLLHKYKEKYGGYPASLDSLTKLDSTDYSYMSRAWKIQYQSKDGGNTFSIDEFSEAQADSLDQVRKDDVKKLLEHSKKWKECVDRIQIKKK